MTNVKQIQSNEYQKGYAAGKRKLESDSKSAEYRAEKEKFRRDVLRDALVGLVTGQNRWGVTTDGKHKLYSTVEEYATLANKVANAAAKYF